MSLMSVYNLSEIPEFARLLNTSNSLESASDAEDNKYINVTNYSTKSNEKYRIVLSPFSLQNPTKTHHESCWCMELA